MNKPKEKRQYWGANLYEKPRTSTLAISCDADEWSEVRMVAKKAGVTVSDLLRDLIRAGWEAQGHSEPCPFGPTWSDIVESWSQDPKQ